MSDEQTVFDQYVCAHDFTKKVDLTGAYFKRARNQGLGYHDTAIHWIMELAKRGIDMDMGRIEEQLQEYDRKLSLG